MKLKRIPQTRRDWYRNIYLCSEHWKQLRKEKKRLNPVCEICGSKKKLDVHHKNYRGIYDVLLEDLQTLCRRCHNSRHKFLNRLKKKSLRSKYRGFKRLLHN